MRRKILLLCLLIITLLFVTGCWNRKELNELAIAVGMGIDKSGDQYRVAVQVVEPSEIAGKKGGKMTPVAVYQATGNTIFEALRRITTISPRKIYAAHLRILVLGESLARDGIGQTLDLLSRDQEIRTDFYVVVAKQSNALDTLKILTHLEAIPAVKLYSTLETSEKAWAPSVAVTLDDLISELVSKGRHPVLTGLTIQGNRKVGETKQNVEKIMSSALLQYSGLAVFKKDKLIGWLNEEEGKAYNYIQNKVKSTVGFVNCPQGGTLSFEVIRSKTKVKGSVRDKQPRIDIEVRVEINVGEVQCHLDLTKKETIAELEQLADHKVEGFIEATINKVQKKYKADIFGFGEVIHRSNPKDWNQLQTNWDKTFANMPVNVKVTHKIRHLGTVTNSFLEQMKK